MLSVNRKCEQSVTTNERRTKVLGADKEKVHGDRTLGNIGGNLTTTKIQCLTEEVAVRVKTNVIVILI